MEWRASTKTVFCCNKFMLLRMESNARDANEQRKKKNDTEFIVLSFSRMKIFVLIIYWHAFNMNCVCYSLPWHCFASRTYFQHTTHIPNQTLLIQTSFVQHKDSVFLKFNFALQFAQMELHWRIIIQIFFSAVEQQSFRIRMAHFIYSVEKKKRSKEN